LLIPFFIIFCCFFFNKIGAKLLNSAEISEVFTYYFPSFMFFIFIWSFKFVEYFFYMFCSIHKSWDFYG